MTKFKAGISGNPNGRPKGKPNKSTKELRERIAALIDNNFDGIQADINQLEPKDRLDFLIKLFEYSLPKLQRVTNEVTIEPRELPNNDKFEEVRRQLKI